ncbi:MAG: hypothetical protein E2O61_12360 [Gammaproteobacteria bacterium]|nr:MAG: hypothetical protein E2O61_12360 [Gammaproteobacteria bacterium]
MRKYKFGGMSLGFTLVIPLIWLAQPGATAVAPESEVHSVTVPFSESSRPGLLKMSLLSGSITVRVHSQPDVVFEYSSPALVRDDEERKEGEMFVIRNDSFDFEITENDNIMDFDMDSWNNRVTLINVKVPVNTSLKLETVNGNILVEGVAGGLELAGVNGRIEATSISGLVVAETVNGSVKVEFNEITPDRFMAFSTHNGRIDVTFPPDIKADVYLDTTRGSIYSDFKIELDNSPVMVSDDTDERGTRIKVEKQLRGTINGGGPEMRFETYNGSIYIRSSTGRAKD